SVVYLGTLFSIKEVSRLVPPISIVIKFLYFVFSAISLPVITPPAGPESIVLTGIFVAASVLIMPPFDCIIYNSSIMLISFKYLSKYSKLYFIFGMTYPLSTAVLVLSYSLISGKTSVDNVTDV